MPEPYEFDVDAAKANARGRAAQFAQMQPDPDANDYLSRLNRENEDRYRAFHASWQSLADFAVETQATREVALRCALRAGIARKDPSDGRWWVKRTPPIPEGVAIP
jgi:hypothetical protein